MGCALSRTRTVTHEAHIASAHRTHVVKLHTRLPSLGTGNACACYGTMGWYAGRQLLSTENDLLCVISDDRFPARGWHVGHGCYESEIPRFVSTVAGDDGEDVVIVLAAEVKERVLSFSELLSFLASHVHFLFSDKRNIPISYRKRERWRAASRFLMVTVVLPRFCVFSTSFPLVERI